MRQFKTNDETRGGEITREKRREHKGRGETIQDDSKTIQEARQDETRGE